MHFGGGDKVGKQSVSAILRQPLSPSITHRRLYLAMKHAGLSIYRSESAFYLS